MDQYYLYLRLQLLVLNFSDVSNKNQYYLNRGYVLSVQKMDQYFPYFG